MNILPQKSPKTVWLNLARGFQVVILCLTVGLFIASIPVNYKNRIIVCKTESCPNGQLTAKAVGSLAQIGLSVDSFVKITIGLDILLATVFTITAIVIFIRKPNDVFTIFTSIMLVTFGVATFSGSITGIGGVNLTLLMLTGTIALIGNCCFTAFLFVFPNGIFTPRWTIAILAGWVLLQLPRYYLPGSPLNLAASIPLLYNILFSVGILSGLLMQVYRYRKVSNAVEKQQTKWVIFGLALSLSGYLIVREISLGISDPYGNGLLADIGLNILATLFILLFPISISIAVLRFRLWDINPIINRTLVYGALSALTIGLYVLAVGYFSSLFQNNQANIIISFIATGVVAALFEPLRERLQRVVNRLMYGERDDPTTVLMRLSQRLDSTLAPDSVLQTIVESLAQTLRLPYAAISLFCGDKEPCLVSHYGLPVAESIHLPLTYQTERVGELIVAPRAPGEIFSHPDMKLINIIAQQAGIAAHTVRLNNDLQESRERLVTAQEEERRRLRRDLHDGVGPTLASLSQRIDTASDLIKTDPEKSIQLLKELKSQVKGTIAEIRRLVYALRPPVLDEFGLYTAIREHLAQYSGPNGIQITFELIDPLPPLPAAVEVAAYRIALEAFTNIVKHSQASACHIKIDIDDKQLVLEVSDNGKGLSSNIRSGVGFTSMRERASELGGQCIIENSSSGGTYIRTRLPMGKE